MHNQIMVETIRLKKSSFFYLTIIAFIVLSLMYSLKMVFVDMDNSSGAKAFLGTISDTSLMFILTMFASYFIGNEFTNRTIDNEIRIGYSRLSVIISRVIVVLPFILMPYLAYTITCTLIFGISNGFWPGLSIQDLFIRLSLFVLQVMAIQSISVFIMFACKKASLGMMINVCFSVLTCNLLRGLLKDGQLFFKYTSFYRIMMNNQSLTSQDILISFVSAIVNLIIMICLTYVVFKKTELK